MNALFKSTSIGGHSGFVGEALPIERVMDIVAGAWGKKGKPSTKAGKPGSRLAL